MLADIPAVAYTGSWSDLFSAEFTAIFKIDFFTSSTTSDRRNITVTVISRSIAPSHAVIVPSVTRIHVTRIHDRSDAMVVVPSVPSV